MYSPDISTKGLAKALNLGKDEVFEASFNLLTFFETLHRIDERLQTEKNGKEANSV